MTMAPGDFQAIKCDDTRESQCCKHDAPLPGVAKSDQRRRIVDHQTRVLHRDEAEKHADAGHRSHLQRLRNGIDDPFAYPEDGDEDESHAGYEYRAQGNLPRKAHTEYDPVGEERVEPHAGGHGDGVVRPQAHDRSADRRCHAGGDKDAA